MKLNPASRTAVGLVIVTALTISMGCQNGLAQGISEYGGLMGMPRNVPGNAHQDAVNRLYNSPLKGIGGGNANAGGAPGKSVSGGSQAAQGLAPQQVAALGKKANELLAQAKKAEAAGNAAQADKLYKETLAIRYRIWGERDTKIPEILDKLAEYSRSQGKLDETSIYLNSILTFWYKRVGPGTSERIEPLKKLAQIAEQKKDFKEEANLAKQVFGLVERKRGVQENEILQAKMAWAEAAYRAKYFKDSERLYKSIVEVKEKNNEPIDPDLIAHYADALKNSGFEVEANAILKKYQASESNAEKNDAAPTAKPETQSPPAASTESAGEPPAQSK